jgi:hypothetical protein
MNMKVEEQDELENPELFANQVESIWDSILSKHDNQLTQHASEKPRQFNHKKELRLKYN